VEREAAEERAEGGVVLVPRARREVGEGFTDERDVERDEVCRAFGAADRDDAPRDVVDCVGSPIRLADREKDAREVRPPRVAAFDRLLAFIVSSNASASAAVANERL